MEIVTNPGLFSTRTSTRDVEEQMALPQEPQLLSRSEDLRHLYLRLSTAYSRVAELADQHAQRANSQGRDDIAGVERSYAEQARKHASRARSLAS